ncbi:hypothetical protein N7486_004864 [Penicillium sp. IBT 16267x]|nr:hypothetical protein N7486_004864 [Penicillium sp. IBT 16267x]
MTPVTAILGLAIAIAVKVTAIDIDTSGFLSPRLSYSVGGHAVCVNGIVSVHVSGASNVQLDLPSSTNRTQATQLLLDLFSVNSTLVAQVSGPERQISQQFNISSRLCYPKRNATGHKYSTVQFLTHGVGFSQNYWDFAAPSNSYIDSAAQAGQVTFSYDRLGVGESSHPDPIQIVQGPAQVSLAHALVALTTSLHPFSMDDIKTCATCHGPSRDLARYGRLVRRALLDESTKKLILFLNRGYVPLAKELPQLIQELQRATKRERYEWPSQD